MHFKKNMFKLLSILVLIPTIQCIDPLAIRQTNNGPVEGVEQTSFFGKKYYAFRGIPYAEVPITGKDPYTGAEVDRRFKPPEPLTRKWTEILKVHEFADGCITSTKFLPKATNYSENCLFLNIYVPAGGAETKTVIVYIHGGAFTEGTATNLIYGPDFLIEADNIFVTLNYRLGIFGFMNLGFGEYTGNMGLKDQQMAMKWIHENIEYFSGKKDEVLLSGESAGGASVNYHQLNEESRKYFQRAFLISGSVFNFYALHEPNHLEIMQEFSSIEDKDKLIEHLTKVDSAILERFRSTKDFGAILLQSPWVPTIENSSVKGAFITEPPEEIYKSDKAPQMDTFFSFASQEYLTFNPDLARNTEPLLKGNWNESILLLPFAGFDKETHPHEYKKAFDRLKNVYLNDTSSVDVIKRGNIALLSDMNFGYGILKAMKYQVQANNRGNAKKNTFLQRFSVNADLNLFKNVLQSNYEGAAHGEHMCYLFRCDLMDKLGIYEDKLKIRDSSNVNYNAIMRMVDILTNFARTGNPSIQGDIPFKSSTSIDEIFTQHVTTDPKTTLVNDIMDQMHFQSWKEIEEDYKRIKNIQAVNQ